MVPAVGWARLNIERFTMRIRDREGVVFEGNTYFDFFSAEALANQVGIQEAPRHRADDVELARAKAFALPEAAPFPTPRSQRPAFWTDSRESKRHRADCRTH